MPEELTIEEPSHIDQFATYQRRRGFSPRTIRARGYLLSAFEEWLSVAHGQHSSRPKKPEDPGADRHQGPGGKALTTATRHDIEEWLDAKSLGAQGRYTYTAHLHAFYRWAKREGLVDEDPTTDIDRPRLPHRLPRPIPEADLSTAVERASPTMRAMLLAGAYAGLRAAEIAGLEREDVLEAHDPPLIVVRRGKGGKPRTVPAHPELLAALVAHGLPRTGPVFVNAAGVALKPNNLSDRVRAFLRRSGVDATTHQLRHTFGTAVYRRSRDLLLTASLMGHSSPQTTAIYAAFDPGPAAAVVASLGTP